MPRFVHFQLTCLLKPLSVLFYGRPCSSKGIQLFSVLDMPVSLSGVCFNSWLSSLPLAFIEYSLHVICFSLSFIFPCIG